MSFVRFKGNTEVFQIKIEVIGSNRVRLYPPFPNAGLTGFELMTQLKSGKVYGDYLSYTTLYRKMEDDSIILSNDGSVWKEPVYAVTFEGQNCTMVGETTQQVITYEELEIPVAIPDENYEFLEWFPVIPLHGKITKNEKYTAKTA